MNTNISKEQAFVEEFLDSFMMKGTVVRTIIRANGDVDRRALPNVVTALGLDNLADRAVIDTTSKYNWIAIGTANYTAHINSQEILECDRKQAALISASRDLIVAIATWGGAADSVTSNQIEMAAIANHQTSGSGHYLNVVAGVSTVLADSDFLNLEMQVRVGSHNIAT
jgi:hypothetical protein